jgi:polyhydroxybutyrate depolymerase
VTSLPDLDPNDKTTVERLTYPDCSPGTDVVLVAVNGGGHTLPGGDQYAPVWLVGPVSHDLDGAQTIWDFLSAHRLPQLVKSFTN